MSAEYDDRHAALEGDIVSAKDTMQQPELFGHHYIDRALLDDDGLPYQHLDDPRINDLPASPERSDWPEGLSPDCPF